MSDPVEPKLPTTSPNGPTRPTTSPSEPIPSTSQFPIIIGEQE